MKNKRLKLNLLIIFCITVFIISGTNLFMYFFNTYNSNKKLEEIVKNTETKIHEEIKLDNKSIVPELSKLYNENKDTIGILKIPNTKVNYPVMQNTNDPEFYLSHDFYKNEDKNGLPFLDYRSDLEKPSTNLIIHGHNMKNGLIFNTLTKYKNKDFFESHKNIIFNTLFEESEYEIISVFLSKIYNEDENVFKYYEFVDSNNKNEFNKFIENIKNLSLHNIDSTAKFGDSLITLSTCEYSQEDGRLVIVARKK